MSLWMTGDTHGHHSMNKLSKIRWPEGRSLTRDDFVVVTGDFGLLYCPEEDTSEAYWRKWLMTRSFTVLFCCGNHENFNRLYALPQEERFGGIVGKVADNIFHLRRGEIYELAGKKVLAFGGATSVDKESRLADVSWWAAEVPNYAEMENCLTNLEKHQYKVDIIVAHTCPNAMADVMAARLGMGFKTNDPTGRMLEHIVTSCEFDDFYCGHWHVDIDMGKYHFLYDKIVKAG